MPESCQQKNPASGCPLDTPSLPFSSGRYSALSLLPAKGATAVLSAQGNMYRSFQSTHPQGVRRWAVAHSLFVSTLFQSTHPRGVRLQGAVGINMGIIRFATLSDRTYYEPLNSFKRHEDALHKTQRALTGKQNSAATGRKQKPASSVSIPVLAMPAAIFCTRPRSAKTTRWCVLRTCRSETCRSRHQEQGNHREETSEPSQD